VKPLLERLLEHNVLAAKGATKVQLEAEMTSVVTITRGNEGVLGADGSLTMDPDAPVVYTGPARLGNAQGPVTYSLGEEVQFFSSGSCTIPIGDPGTAEDVPQVNDLVHIDAGDDPGLVGRNFRVVDVEAVGMLPGGRRLQIVGVQRAPNWVDSAVRHPGVGLVPDEVPPQWQIDAP
jgi:hypothetical protein